MGVSRVALLRKDGIYEIRLIHFIQGKIDLDLGWPDGIRGTFSGYTLNGFLKYKEV